jgi:hypothetical protein
MVAGGASGGTSLNGRTGVGAKRSPPYFRSQSLREDVPALTGNVKYTRCLFSKLEGMRRTIQPARHDHLSDLSGCRIPPGKGATIRVELGRTKRAVWELRVTQDEADRLLARRGQHGLDRPAFQPPRELKGA